MGVEDERRNVLKARLVVATGRAEAARRRLGAAGRNPLTDEIELITRSWTAGGSALRTALIDNLDGVGAGIASAFLSARVELADRRDGEPDEIDTEADPGNAWKTSTASIDARVRVWSQNPYR